MASVDLCIAGFIGLVVALAVIFVASCAGVFFLLRYRKHGGRTTTTKSGELEAQFPGQRGTLFGFRSRNRSRGGWVQASGGDEWDADLEEEAGMNLRRSSYGDSGGSTTRELPYGGNVAGGSASSVRLEAPGVSNLRDPGYDDPYNAPHRSITLASEETSERSGDSGIRQMSNDSATSPTAFPGGTKFHEALS